MSAIVYRNFYVEGAGYFQGLARIAPALMLLVALVVDAGFFFLAVFLASRGW